MWDDLPVLSGEEYARLQRERVRLMGQFETLSSAVTTTLRGQIVWNGKPEIDDDDGGSAGVREPRRPRPAPPHLGMEKAPGGAEGLILTAV